MQLFAGRRTHSCLACIPGQPRCGAVFNDHTGLGQSGVNTKHAYASISLSKTSSLHRSLVMSPHRRHGSAINHFSSDLSGQPCPPSQGDHGSPGALGRSASQSEFGGPEDDMATQDDDTLADEPEARLTLPHEDLTRLYCHETCRLATQRQRHARCDHPLCTGGVNASMDRLMCMHITTASRWVVVAGS